MLLAARARICTTYISMLDNPDFVKVPCEERVAALKDLCVRGVKFNSGGEKDDSILQHYNAVLTKHVDRDNGVSLVKALHASVQALRFSHKELNKLLVDGVTFIPDPSVGTDMISMIEEVQFVLSVCFCF